MLTSETASSGVEGAHRTLIVGDIHGRYGKLMKVLEHADFDESTDRLVGLGDYIDRGRESATVLSYLVDRQKRYPHRDVYLRGNHEDVVVSVLEGHTTSLGGWLDACEGFSALASYRIAPERFWRDGDTYVLDGIPLRTSRASIEALRKILPEDHLDFLLQTRYSSALDQWFLCHGGLRLGTRIEETQNFELVWGDRRWVDATKKELQNGPYQPPVICAHWHNHYRSYKVGYKRLIISSDTDVAVLIYDDMVVVDSRGDRVEIKRNWYE